jgi:hypothetical protein
MKTSEVARKLADLTAFYIDTLIAEGWAEGAVLAGVHSGVAARMATAFGPEFTAAALERAADGLRGVYHA